MDIIERDRLVVVQKLAVMSRPHRKRNQSKEDN